MSRISEVPVPRVRARFMAAVLAFAIVVPALVAVPHPAPAETVFRRIPVQFIAALGAPEATSGTGAQHWGIWREDPGPRGVRLTEYDTIERAGGTAPAQWRFDRNAWWLEEYGRIMEKPDYPIPPGKYVVTGDRRITAVLTIHAKDASGDMKWELDGGNLYDVTHLRCRSALYTPAEDGATCLPTRADASRFPVSPGAEMPAIEGCAKQDHAVLFIIGVEAKP